MSENDITLVTLLEDEARYADLVNVVLAEGEQVILPEHVQEADPSARSIVQRLWKRVPVHKNRDSIRRIVMGMQAIMIGVEHQSEVHYAMPARVMMYDALHYDRQLGQLKRFHKRRRDLKGAEFLNGFARIWGWYFSFCSAHRIKKPYWSWSSGKNLPDWRKIYSMCLHCSETCRF